MQFVVYRPKHTRCLHSLSHCSCMNETTTLNKQLLEGKILLTISLCPSAGETLYTHFYSYKQNREGTKRLLDPGNLRSPKPCPELDDHQRWYKLAAFP